MFKRRRFKQTQSLKDRLINEVKRLRQEAQKLPPGIERQSKMRKARQVETASHIDEWLRSPGLRRPE